MSFFPSVRILLLKIIIVLTVLYSSVNEISSMKSKSLDTPHLIFRILKHFVEEICIKNL